MTFKRGDYVEFDTHDLYYEEIPAELRNKIYRIIGLPDPGISRIQDVTDNTQPSGADSIWRASRFKFAELTPEHLALLELACD